MEIDYLGVKLLEVKAESEPGTFSGYGAIFGNEDLQGDVLRKGAFTETLSEWRDRGKFPPMLLQHGGMGGFNAPSPDSLLPVGEWLDMREDGRGLPVKGRLFALGTERGQYIYEGLKAGSLDGLSIGYKTREKIDGTRAGEPDRILTNVDLWEVSIVTFPANPKARISSVKALTSDERRELEDRLRDAGLSRSDAKTAVAILTELQRDAGEPRGQRDAAAAGELGELLRPVRELEASLVADSLRGLLSTLATSGGSR